jgi:hypothetical protein
MASSSSYYALDAVRNRMPPQYSQLLKFKQCKPNDRHSTVKIAYSLLRLNAEENTTTVNIFLETHFLDSRHEVIRLQITIENDIFAISMNLSNFSAAEINVTSTSTDVIVAARNASGFTRRRFAIPPNFSTHLASCQFLNGRLTIHLLSKLAIAKRLRTSQNAMMLAPANDEPRAIELAVVSLPDGGD